MEQSIDVQSQVLQNTLAEVASRTDNTSGAESSEACCVICLDHVGEPCEARPCGHNNFDYLCLHLWLQRQRKCPLCKAEIEVVRYGLQDLGFTKETVYLGLEPGVSQPWGVNSPEEQESIREALQRPRRRRRRSTPPPLSQISEDEAVARRRVVYRDQLFSLHVGTNRVSQYREFTPSLFQQDDHLVSRARMWLRRELKVFEFLHASSNAHGATDIIARRRANNAEFLLEYIIAILKTVDVQGSQGQAEDMLQEFLGRENTRLLLHELKNFLRSPYSLESWDRNVQYPKTRKRRHDEVDGQSEQSSSSERTRLEGGSSRDSLRRTRGDSYRPQYSQHGDRRRP